MNRLKTLVLCSAFFFCLALAACGSRDAEPEVTTFKLNEDGSVTQTIIGTLGESASVSALKGYISEQITAYGSTEESPSVVLESVDSSGEEGSVTVKMTYSSIADYSAFNRVDAFNGTVLAAYQNGFSFGNTFHSANGYSMPGYALPAEYPGLNVLVLKEAMNVILPEEAVLVSDDITMNEDGSYTIGRSVKENVPELFQSVNKDCSYILYKQTPEEEN